MKPVAYLDISENLITIFSVKSKRKYFYSRISTLRFSLKIKKDENK